jgi:hypothetical protein
MDWDEFGASGEVTELAGLLSAEAAVLEAVWANTTPWEDHPLAHKIKIKLGLNA